MIGLGVFRFEIDLAVLPLNSTETSSWLSGSIQVPNFHSNEDKQIRSMFYGSSFWLTQLVTALLAILLPYLRPIRASMATIIASTITLLINLSSTIEGPGISLGFEFITILILFSLYILLSFIGETHDRQKLTELFCQYVPPELVDQFSRNPNSISINGEAREITVLFCDIYSFTSISEKLDPQDVAIWLNRYFSLISQIVVTHSGTLDKYIGDSVMAFWGAPANNDSHASDALAAAFDMQKGIEELSELNKKDGLPGITIGIGISTGIGNVGNMGSRYRMAYTVVGDTVNMAQRLERQTRYYKVPIIVSELTAQQATGVLYRELDNIKIKGREERVKMFQPMCLERGASPEQLENLAEHGKAMEHLTKKELNRAALVFESLQCRLYTDHIYEIYLNRIKELNHTRQTGT